MVSPPKTDPPPHQNVTIIVGGKRRLLFRVEERSSGDLLIIVRYPKFLSPAEDRSKALPIVDLHCSVHQTAQSPTRINAITAVIKFDGDAQEVKELHYTKAMKHNNFAAHVFALRASNLDHEQFEAGDIGGEIRSLRHYNPSHFQLIYQVLVSSQDVPTLTSKGNVNCLQFNASSFLVTVLWSFLSTPSVPFGTILPIATIKPEELGSVEDPALKQIYELMPEGFDPAALLDHFVSLGELLKKIYISRMEENNPPSKQRDEMIEFIKTATLFAKGDQSNHKYRKHLRRIAKLLRKNSLVFPA
jgi:hypothetical protein